MSYIQNNYGTALYYPFINIQDMDWLKTALLYWDRIRCISPGESYFNDEIKYLIDAKCIIPTSPNPYANKASISFMNQIKKYCNNQGELDSNVIQYLKNNYPEYIDVPIHSDKLCEEIFQEMGHKVLLGNFCEDVPNVVET